MVERAKNNPKIDFVLNSVIEEINGNDNGVNSISIRNLKNESMEVISANGVFVAIGHTPATTFLDGVVDRDEAGYIRVEGRQYQNQRSGNFRRRRLRRWCLSPAISAAGMGCRAALDAQSYLQ